MEKHDCHVSQGLYRTMIFYELEYGLVQLKLSGSLKKLKPFPEHLPREIYKTTIFYCDKRWKINFDKDVDFWHVPIVPPNQGFYFRISLKDFVHGKEMIKFQPDENGRWRGVR